MQIPYATHAARRRAIRARNRAALIIWACLALGWIVAGLAVLA